MAPVEVGLPCSAMSKVLKLYGPGDLRYEEHHLPVLGPRDVRVRTRLGAISAGTEGAWYFGTDPQLDPGFKPGRVARPKFPKLLGYEKLAVVEDVGGEVDSLVPGQRVVGHYGHAEEFVLPAEGLIPVPDHVDDVEAVAYSLSTVALHAIRRSRLQIGDDVLITGQGFIGLMAVKLCRLAGAGRIAVTDPYPLRRDLGLRSGADEALDPGACDVAATLAGGPSGGLFDVALETSSSFEALHDAMGSVRRNGRICVLSQLKGDYPAHPLFGLEFHLEELELITADGRGDVDKLTRWYFHALGRGEIPGIRNLISHSIPFSDLESGFRLMEAEPESVIKILVTYS